MQILFWLILKKPSSAGRLTIIISLRPRQVAPSSRTMLGWSKSWKAVRCKTNNKQDGWKKCCFLIHGGHRIIFLSLYFFCFFRSLFFCSLFFFLFMMFIEFLDDVHRVPWWCPYSTSMMFIQYLHDVHTVPSWRSYSTLMMFTQQYLDDVHTVPQRHLHSTFITFIQQYLHDVHTSTITMPVPP